MTWTTRYTASAARSLRRLDGSVLRKVRAAIATLAEDPHRGKPLQLSLKGFRSWRTGDFRIVYTIVEDRVEIIVVALGHRRDVYERLSRRLR